MRLVGGAGYAVGLVGIGHEAELFAGFDQRFDHLDAVLEMDVVVAGAVHEQQRSVQLVGDFGEVEVGVAGGGFVGGQAVIAFGVDGIVVAPTGDGGNCGAGFEYVGVGEGVESHGTAVA